MCCRAVSAPRLRRSSLKTGSGVACSGSASRKRITRRSVPRRFCGVAPGSTPKASQRGSRHKSFANTSAPRRTMRAKKLDMAAVATSIILPVYHQAAELSEIVDRAHAALSPLPGLGEILLVANGGGDATLSTAAALAESDPMVRLVTSQQGWGAAVIAGL